MTPAKPFPFEIPETFIKSPSLNISTVISWKDVEEIIVDKSKSKVVGLKIHSKDKSSDLTLWDDIEDYEELFNEILLKAKDSDGIKIIDKRGAV